MEEFKHRAAEYRRQLIEFVRRRLPRSDREAASDLVQDTLLEAQERAEFVRALTPKQTLAWLVTILKYKMANANRTRRRQGRLRAREQEAKPHGSEGLVDPLPSPRAVAERKERLRRIERALAELTPAQRLAIVLHYYAGWTLEEIGRQTGTTRSSVLQLIRRGLGHLARCGDFSADDLA